MILLKKNVYIKHLHYRALIYTSKKICAIQKEITINELEEVCVIRNNGFLDNFK